MRLFSDDAAPMCLRLITAFLVIRQASGALNGAGSLAHKSTNVTYFPPYAGWETHIWIVLFFAELIGIYCVYRLWRRKSSKSPLVKLLNSILLLIPIVGPLFYFFVNFNPTPHYRSQ